MSLLFSQQLKRKTAELTKACEKQYKLEQELAFHKIDAKFEPLGYFPDTLEVSEHGNYFLPRWIKFPFNLAGFLNIKEMIFNLGQMSKYIRVA